MDTVRIHKKTLAILIGIVALFAFATYSVVSPKGIFSGLKNDLKEINPTSEAAFYTNLDGVPIALTDFKGKPLIINSWATWMPFSKDELTLLSQVQKKYGDKISILAINRKEDTATIKSFASVFGIDTSSIVFLVDPTDNFYAAIGGYAMPETVFYSFDGTISSHKRGVLTEDELMHAAEAIIEQ